jgi:hypothetical protein
MLTLVIWSIALTNFYLAAIDSIMALVSLSLYIRHRSYLRKVARIRDGFFKARKALQDPRM